MTEETVHTGRSKSWIILGIVLAIIGAGISMYSINHHLDLKANGVTDAACNINQTFSCDSVVASEYSEIFGIPLGVWGLGYFLGLLVLLGLSLFKAKNYRDNMLAYSASAAIGVVASLTLGIISLVSLGALCPTCIGIYIVTILQAIALFIYKSEIPDDFSFNNLFNGGTNLLITVAAIVLLYNNVMPKPQPKQPGHDMNENGEEFDINLGSQAHEFTINKSAYSGLGEDFRKGGDNAKVTIVEFADFECGACERMATSLKPIANEFKDDILIVFKNYPLDQACNPSINRKIHENACSVAVLARCAGNFGKFWQYHDLAFANQKGITLDKAKTYAMQVGLTSNQIDTCLSDPSIIEKIKDDIKVGNQIGVTGTPSVYLNGRKVHNPSPIVLRTEISKILDGN